MRKWYPKLAMVTAIGGVLLALCGGMGCSDSATTPPPAPPPGGGGTPGPAFQATPLNDLGSNAYLGFTGGLYPNGSNLVPAPHHAAGLARAAAIQPLDRNGRPLPTGQIVLLSIGMSNTTQEFCSAGGGLPCSSWTFMGQAAADAAVNHTTLTLANGALGGRTTNMWTSASSAEYDRVRDTVLTPQGLSEQQVQIAWLKEANAGPTTALPSVQADAYTLESGLGSVLRAMKVRYPNLQMVFLSSRIYAGYATTTLNPEPYAYESGFAVKWVIQAQIDQMNNGGTVVDARAGDLNYNSVAPWIAWGPYLWADGTTPRSDGLIWLQTDLQFDGTHPSQAGQTKVGTMLLNFFKTSPYAKCWFVYGGTCP